VEAQRKQLKITSKSNRQMNLRGGKDRKEDTRKKVGKKQKKKERL
jgi:hypothetical protein